MIVQDSFCFALTMCVQHRQDRQEAGEGQCTCTEQYSLNTTLIQGVCTRHDMMVMNDDLIILLLALRAWRCEARGCLSLPLDGGRLVV